MHNLVPIKSVKKERKFFYKITSQMGHGIFT